MKPLFSSLYCTVFPPGSPFIKSSLKADNLLFLLGATCLLLFPIWATPVAAQDTPAEVTRAFPWRNIGPANMMGRISSVDGYQKDFRVLLVGSASGGVWKTTNAGTTWDPIFDHYGSQSIGDIAFFQADTSIIWVGTGEATSRNSVGWGDGVYKSVDGGRSFVHMGLRDTYQIASVLPHPTDPSIVYVAAAGHLFDYTGSRGIFKSEDGGDTWTKLTNGLPDTDRLGASIITMHPDNPDVLYAGMYDRLRRPHHMQSGGPGGGIFKSTDAGASWFKLTQGLPGGMTGQIDVDIFRQNPDILVAYVEADENLPAGVPGGGIYRSNDGGASWQFLLKHFSRPYYHGRIRIHPDDEQLIYVVSRDFQYSTDGGQSFTRGRPWSVDGGDDHDLWISPQNGDMILMATDQGARLSMDRGKSAFMFNNMAIGQYYAIGVDMRDPYWVYGGLQDNGGWATPSNSRDRRGIFTDHVTVVNGGDGFHMQVDPTDWRKVYTMTHVGFAGMQNMETREHHFITPRPQNIVNFDQYYDPSFDEKAVDYTINPGDHWTWFDIPSPTINGASLPPQFRFNWNSPLVMSPSNPHTLYLGGSHLFKTIDQGQSWRIISPDLTKNDPETRNAMNSGGLTKDVTGAENIHTIYTIDESTLDPAIVWTGSDDGLVHVTRDGGATWTNVSVPSLREGLWVSRVEASRFDAGTAYVTLDGHWVGDINPYVFKTIDFGESWTDISSNIPREMPGNSVYTIVEDHINPNLLFIGTEFGCFATLDGGASWFPFMNGLPPVAVHDLVIHPRDNDLIAGTHGRSIWIADDISPLQQMTDSFDNSSPYVFHNRPGTRWLNFSKGRIQTDFKFRGQNPPSGAPIHFYLPATPADSMVTLHIASLNDDKVAVVRSSALKGLNTFRWNMHFPLNAATIDYHKTSLGKMLESIRSRLANADEEQLFHMARDLRAGHRAPMLFNGKAYPNMNDDAGVLRDHLGYIEERLDEANAARSLGNVRSELLHYSSILGDDAYRGFYGDPIVDYQAQAGMYRVRLMAGDDQVDGMVEVREDPLKHGHP